MHKYSLEKCPQCDKLVSKISEHIKEVHNPNLRFKCKFCDYSNRHRTSINNHVQLVHEGVIYQCEQCEYVAPNRRGLRTHVSVHMGIKFPCQHYNYRATRKENLRSHVLIVHEKKVYHCDQCGYKAQRKGQLTKHFDENHA